MSKVPEKKESEIGKNVPAMAFQASTSNGAKHIVGIGNLRVMILQAGNFWYAQGMEIDYAAQGASVDEVKERFGVGLKATIYEHLTIYGSIKNLLVAAPKPVWDEFYESVTGKIKARYSQVSAHEMLPFENIDYYEISEVAC